MAEWDGLVAVGTGTVPHLTIRDHRGAEAINFYAAAFGAEEMMRSAEENGPRLMHAALVLNGGPLMLHDDFPETMGGGASPPPACCTLHLQVEDADAAWTRAVEAGCTVAPLADQFWGDRYGQLLDPFGHRWSIGAAIRR